MFQDESHTADELPSNGNNGHALRHPSTVRGESVQERRIFPLGDPRTFNQHVAQDGVPPWIETGVLLGVASGVFSRYQAYVAQEAIKISESLDRADFTEKGHRRQ